MADANSKPPSPRWAFERAVRESTLKPPDRLVLFVIAQEVTGSLALERQHSLSRSRITKRTGLAASTVDDCIKRLSGTGWLSNSRSRRQWPQWTLQAIAATPCGGVDDAEPERAATPPDGDAYPATRGSTAPPDGVSTSQTEPDVLPDLKAGADAPSPRSRATPQNGEARAVGYEAPRSGGMKTPRPIRARRRRLIHSRRGLIHRRRYRPGGRG